MVSPSSGSQDQLCPTLAQTDLGSLQSIKSCFSGPSVFEMGEPSSLTSPITQAHLEIPFISPSDNPEELRSFFKMPAQRAVLPLLDCCSGSVDISSDHLTVAGMGAGYYSDDLTARPMVGFNNCIEMKSSDSTAVVGLKLGTISDGLVATPIMSNHFFSTGFYSNSHELVQMGTYWKLS